MYLLISLDIEIIVIVLCTVMGIMGTLAFIFYWLELYICFTSHFASFYECTFPMQIWHGIVRSTICSPLFILTCFKGKTGITVTCRKDGLTFLHSSLHL